MSVTTTAIDSTGATVLVIGAMRHGEGLRMTYRSVQDKGCGRRKRRYRNDSQTTIASFDRTKERIAE